MPRALNFVSSVKLAPCVFTESIFSFLLPGWDAFDGVEETAKTVQKTMSHFRFCKAVKPHVEAKLKVAEKHSGRADRLSLVLGRSAPWLCQ